MGRRICVADVIVLLVGCSSSEDRAQAYYERGVQLAAEGKPAKAGLEFRNALKLKKDFVDALFALGEVEERQGHFENASKFYFSVTESSPKHIGARVKLAYILLAAGNADEALKFANQAIAITEDDPSVLVVKAAVELKRGNRKGAVNLANEALKLDPEYVDALMVLAADRLKDGDPSAALQFLEKAPQESERNIGLQILRLTALDALGDQPGVEGLFSKLIELFPETPAFQEGLVQWYLGKGRKDDAERTVREYAAANPTDEKAQFRLIAFLNTTKGPAAAIEELKTLVSEKKQDGDLNYKLQMALAQLQFTSGDRSEAIDIAQSLVAATDGDKRNAARIAFARMAATEQKFDEAEKSVDAVIGEDPKNADALGVRAWIRLTKGEVSKATDDLLVAVNEAPQNAQLIELLGEAYERAGLVTLAEEQYAKALSIGSNPANAGLQLAQFHLRYGRTEQARRVLEDVLARAPKDRRVLTLLARLRLATQDWVGAQEIADKLARAGQRVEGCDSRQDRGRSTGRTGQTFRQHQSPESVDVDRWRSTGGSCRSRACLCSVGTDVRCRRPAQGATRQEPEKRPSANPAGVDLCQHTTHGCG